MTYIKTILPEEADGLLAEIYDEIIEKRGKIGSLLTAQSLHPETIRDHLNLYMRFMFSKSPLKRYQREMMAVVVSVTNNCDYCIEHHVQALKHFWKDSRKITLLKKDYAQLNLNKPDLLLCELAKTLTLKPFSERIKPLLDAMKQAGLNDRAILDAVLIVSYFNFVNRMVLGLGVEKEADTGGYIYDNLGN